MDAEAEWALPTAVLAWAPAARLFLFLLLRLIHFIVELALVLAILLWVHRTDVVSVAAYGHGVLVDLEGIDVWPTWSKELWRRLRQRDVPFEVLHVRLANLVVRVPGGTLDARPGDASAPCAGSEDDVFTRVETIAVRVERRAKESFWVDAEVERVALKFVAYDRRFKDSNVKRLADTLAAIGKRPPRSPPLEGAGSPQGAVFIRRRASSNATPPPAGPKGPVVVRSVVIRRASVAVARVVSTGPTARTVAVMPPITLLEERIDPSMFEGGVSLGMLMWVNRFVLRVIASTSIDAFSATVTSATAQASTVIGRSLDMVDAVSRGHAGSGVLLGATGGMRSVLSSTVDGSRLIITSVGDGAKEIASAAVTGSATELVGGIGRGAHSMSRGFGDGAAVLITSFHECAGQLGPCGRGLVDGSCHVCNGMVGGTSAMVGGVCGGMAHAAVGAARCDPINVVRGGGQVVGGIVEGSVRMAEGVSSGATAVASGCSTWPSAQKLIAATRMVRGVPAIVHCLRRAPAQSAEGVKEDGDAPFEQDLLQLHTRFRPNDLHGPM